MIFAKYSVRLLKLCYTFPIISVSPTIPMQPNPLQPETDPYPPMRAAQSADHWARRLFLVPPRAKWLPVALEKVLGTPGQPAMRHLKQEESGEWSIEECQKPGYVPLAEFLTEPAATIWAFVSVAQQSLTALSTLHEAGLGHGNLTLATLLVDRTGNVVLAGPGLRQLAYGEENSGAESPPALPTAVACDDLRNLGRVLREVICGNPDAKVTATRPEIGPMVAAWIDWLASPPLGRAARSAVHASTVLNDLRMGKRDHKPWEDAEEAHSYVLCSSSKDKELKARKIGAGLVDGNKGGGNLRSALISIVTFAALLGGSIFAINYCFEDKKIDAPQQSPIGGLTGPGTPPGVELDFDAIASGYDPSTVSLEVIDKLMSSLPEIKGVGTSLTDWAKKLEEQRAATRTSENAALPPGKGDAANEPEWLYTPDVLPITGQPSSGRAPGDYYIVWRTHQFILTQEECWALQRAIIKSAGYCGVQLISWTVLPNQAGVVVRVPPLQPISDETLLRRIALLRGEKVAKGVEEQLLAAGKDGKTAGADKVRLQWNASIGSAAGFLSVVRSVRVVSKEALGNIPLWKLKPSRMHFLQPDTNQILNAAGIIDTASIRAKLAASAGDWPFCGFAAAQRKYKGSLYGVAVLMQPNPYRSLAPATKEELLSALDLWRRYLVDFPGSLKNTPETAIEAASKVTSPAVPTVPQQPK